MRTGFKLDAPTGAVVGARDVYAMAAFLNALGCQPLSAPTVTEAMSRELYGIDGPRTQVVMATPGTDRVIRIVETPNGAAPFEPVIAGPYGFDFYTRDPLLSQGLARATGASATGLVEYDVRGDVMLSDQPQYELRYVGPEALSVYVTDIKISGSVFPTVLDDDQKRLHSEMNMMVWIVEELDETVRFWTDEAGLEVVVDRYEGEEGMIDLMAHPHPMPLRVVNVSDSSRRCRLEFMHYPEGVRGSRPEWPLPGGLHAAVFHVPSVDSAIEALPSAEFGAPCEADDGNGLTRAVAGRAPGGVRFELWER